MIANLHEAGGFGLPTLSIVVPVFNSSECLEELAVAIERALLAKQIDYELVLVNDCSTDGSWLKICRLCKSNQRIVGVNLRKNFGQDHAILEGFRHTQGQYIAVMDDDVQHHPDDLPALLERARAGADVVYADFRKKKQSLWKNLGSWFNGKCAEWLIDKPPHIYLSPYKIVRHEVAQMVAEYDGPDPYVDGLLFQMTSRIEQVPAEHHPRYRGRSNFTLFRSIRVWARLAFTFSAKPLRLATLLGICLAGLGLAAALVVIVYRLSSPGDFPPEAVGWASLIVTVLTMGGIQMVFAGIMGEYLGRTFLHVKKVKQVAVAEVVNGRTAAPVSREIQSDTSHPTSVVSRSD